MWYNIKMKLGTV